nr:hypothetical protein [Piscibacillus salipiscarius]
MALEWTHFDFDNLQIKLVQSIPLFENGKPLIKSTKTDEDIRVVDMPEWYMDEMKIFYKEWKKEKFSAGDQWEEKGHKFVFHTGLGRPYNPQTPTSKWRQIIKNII